MDYVSTWLGRLGYEGSENLVSPSDDFRRRPYAAEIRDLFAPKRGIGASHVYCVGDVPVACFFGLEAKPADASFREWTDAVRRKVWNQGLATVVIVLEPDELAAFSVLQREQGPARLPASKASPIGAWSAFDFASSGVQQRRPDWFNPNLKVDQTLLKNLRDVVELIKGPEVPRESAEALLAQVIFVRYLEARGIVGAHYREKHNLEEIETLLKRGDGASVENLIKKLAKTFNGDFLNSHAASPPPWQSLTAPDLHQITRFLSGEDIKTGQRSFWGYDFSLIPVELLSSVYETFLADRQKEQGAYYTPRHLATMAVEQAFESTSTPHTMRVFDGACGSGILLTTAFQKMLASAELERGRTLSFKERVDLLVGHIYGADIDPTACWITAFSLYLCLLDRLSPADVELLQEDKRTKLPPLVSGDTRGNILTGPAGDFFGGAVPLQRFDVLISNPPWREARGKKLECFEEHIRTEFGNVPLPDRQIAAAYAYKAAQRVRDGGTVALILPLNLMLGLDSFGFRQKLIELFEIERIVNFADLRHILFPNAKNACALVIAKVRGTREGPIIQRSERIEYLVPRADRRTALGVVSINQNDRVFVAPLEAYNNAATFIRRTWGREEDLDLLREMESYGRLRDVIAARGWISNKGFHKTDRNNPPLSLSSPELSWLGELPFLATGRMPKDHALIASDVEFPRVMDVMDTVATPGGARGVLYRGPRVVWRNGLSRDLRIRAFFTERPFAFQHTACAIGAPEEDADLLRLLALYLRSDLATYLINLTSFSAIADRQAVSKTEILDLPFLTPDVHPDPSLARRVLRQVRNFFNSLGAVEEWRRGRAFEEKLDWMNKVVSSYFGIKGRQLELVRQTAQVVSPSVQPTSYENLNNPMNSAPSDALVTSYMKALVDSLQGWREVRHGSGDISAQLLTSDAGSQLSIVQLSVASPDRRIDAADLEPLRRWLEAREAGGQSRLMLEVPDIVIASGPDIYLVKPMQGRYWGTRAALADSDRIVAGINALAQRPH
jgi:hypothetical protein